MGKVLLLIWAYATQFIGVIMWGEYMWEKRSYSGGVGGGALAQVHPLIWGVLCLELLAIAVVMAKAFEKKQEEEDETRV